MSKILDLAQAIEEEFEDQKRRNEVMQNHLWYLEEELNKEKCKRKKAAERLREFASWLESEE